jgi:uncharacterized protein YodC (DUF2158 family)
MSNTPAARPLRPGDVVSLIGDDRLMTVETNEVEKRVGCVWFDVNAQLHRDTFHSATLYLEAGG